MQKYDWLMFETLSTFEICVTCCRNVGCRSLKIGKQIKAFELCLTSCDAFVILQTGYGKRKIYFPFCLVKVFTSNPHASMIVILVLSTNLTALPKNNCINMNWLSLTFLPYILEIKPNFHLKLFCYRQTCHCSWMILDDLLWQVCNINYRLNSDFPITLNLNWQ